MSDLNTSDISDNDLTSLITQATAILNADILVYVHEEQVTAIDSERENKIDGSNTTFYTRHYPIGDLDDDGDVDTDDIKVYLFDSSGARSTATVASIDDADLGKFTLSSAPSSGYTMRVSYRYAPIGISISSVHALVKQACIFLTAALAYTKLRPSQISKYTVDRLTVVQSESEFQHYWNLYRQTVREILARSRMVHTGKRPPSGIPMGD